MSNSIHLISLLLLASGLSIHAQEKRAMTFDEMVGWERISEQRISDNGKWVFCKMEPWRGDATILLYNDKGEEKGSFKPAAKAQFSSSSEYLLVTKTPPLKEVEAEKLSCLHYRQACMQPHHFPPVRRDGNNRFAQIL